VEVEPGGLVVGDAMRGDEPREHARSRRSSWKRAGKRGGERVGAEERTRGGGAALLVKARLSVANRGDEFRRPPQREHNFEGLFAWRTRGERGAHTNSLSTMCYYAQKIQND
jgi:hypothetical protein